MRRCDWLLMLIALEGAPAGLDPVRLQKGMFLLAREAGLPVRERYRFVPYSYGPMSPAVYADLERLLRDGLVERRPVPGYSWGRFAATGTGQARARKLAAGAGARRRAVVARLAGIKRSIATMSFAELLRDIYDRHPEFASRSVFRRP